MSSRDEPLHGRAADEMRDQLRASLAADVQRERDHARAMLAQYDGLDIYNHPAAVEAHAALRASLTHLLAALDMQEQQDSTRRA